MYPRLVSNPSVAENYLELLTFLWLCPMAGLTGMHYCTDCVRCWEWNPGSWVPGKYSTNRVTSSASWHWFLCSLPLAEFSAMGTFLLAKPPWSRICVQSTITVSSHWVEQAWYLNQLLAEPRQTLSTFMFTSCHAWHLKKFLNGRGKWAPQNSIHANLIWAQIQI